jgi:Aspartyl protease
LPKKICPSQAGERLETLTFRSKYNYSNASTGIEVPISLGLGDARFVRLLAKVDTGASFCIFPREYAEELGLNVEGGHHQVVGTAAGRFDAYGHTLTLGCFDWEFAAMVYFAAPANFPRSVVGRSGWLQHFPFGLIDYDAILLLSHHDD